MNSHQKDAHSVIEKFAKGACGENEHPFSLVSSLGLQAREMISLVGAGGKTTLMFRLASELFLTGKRVVTTTTTKILEPISGEPPFVFIHSDEERIKHFLIKHLEEYKHITIAKEKIGSGKLKGISSTLADDLWKLEEIDYLIIEADGAAGRPVKAPREREPVIPSHTTLVLAILGIDGMGMELNEENIFQPERVSKITGIPIGGRITEEGMAILVTHPEGVFKGAPSSSRVVVCLNKVDLENGVVHARRVAHLIFSKQNFQIERIILGQFKRRFPVAEMFSPTA